MCELSQNHIVAKKLYTQDKIKSILTLILITVSAKSKPSMFLNMFRTSKLYIRIFITISMFISSYSSSTCKEEENDKKQINCNCSNAKLEKIITENCNVSKISRYTANYNSITSISKHDLEMLRHMSKKNVYLHNNIISEISEDICDIPDNLFNLLSLSNNIITKLPAQMSCILNLRLDNNKIIVPDNRALFSSTSLKVLYLKNCSITVLYEETFQDMSSLIFLDISENKLQTLPDLILHGMKRNIVSRICFNDTSFNTDLTEDINLDNLRSIFSINLHNNIFNCSLRGIKTKTNPYNYTFMIYAWLFFSTVILIEVCILFIFVFLYFKDKKEE